MCKPSDINYDWQLASVKIEIIMLFTTNYKIYLDLLQYKLIHEFSNLFSHHIFW